jgi:hypothetical protein
MAQRVCIMPGTGFFCLQQKETGERGDERASATYVFDASWNSTDSTKLAKR